MPATRDQLKSAVVAAVDDMRDELVATSHAIHAEPEIAFNEQRAAARLTGALESAGFEVEHGVGGVPTAFRAVLNGTGPGPRVAILAEYDALPDVGHGCGHNIIATAALGGGLAVARAARDFAGQLQLIGTPAEEGGGGKIIMAEAGVFDGVDAAMMVHPSGRNMVRRGSLANSRVLIEFHGKAAHAAGSPDLGINALEAVIQTFVGINGWRLHMRADARVHGIILRGGDAVNIIPSYASAKFSVRARDRAYQRELVAMLRRCAEGAAAMTGARLEWTETRGYDNMVPNPTLSDLCTENMQALGLKVGTPNGDERMGSTDMGDISQILPAIHPYFRIASDETPGHSIEFAAAAASPVGDEALIKAAKTLAMTAVDCLAEPALVERAKAEFQEMQAKGTVAGLEAWREAGRQYPPLRPE